MTEETRSGDQEVSQKEAENRHMQEEEWGRVSGGKEGQTADLMDVLAEGRHCGQLADEVQVGSSKGIQRTAVVQWQVILIDLRQLL